MNMLLEHRCEQGIDIVTIATASMSGHTGAEWRTALAPIIEQGTGWLVIDESRVEYMDSGFDLCTLIVFLKRAYKRGGDIYLAGLTRNVRSLFELTRLDQVFPIFDSVAAAVDAMRARPDFRVLPADSHGE